MIEVQEAVIDKLLSDDALQVMLGFTSPSTGGVSEEQSFNLKTASYPRVHVGINANVPRKSQQSFHGKDINDVYLYVHIFSDQPTSKETGYIDRAIRELLDGAEFIYPGLCFYGCELDSFILKERDQETGIWRVLVRYYLKARIK